MSKDSISVHSPADDMSSGWDVGSGSVPAAPSIYPDINISGESFSDAAVGSKAAESFVGMSETVSKGGASGVQLAEGLPESPMADYGNMAGGLGDPPKPTGSY